MIVREVKLSRFFNPRFCLLEPGMLNGLIMLFARPFSGCDLSLHDQPVSTTCRSMINPFLSRPISLLQAVLSKFSMLSNDGIERPKVALGCFDVGCDVVVSTLAASFLSIVRLS